MEKPALLPLPLSRFDLFQEALRSVHRDGHVEIKGAYYSVPPEFLGQRLWARWDGRTVRLLDQKMRLVAVHVQRQPGVFSTQPVHILPERDQRDRTRDRLGCCGGSGIHRPACHA